MNSIDHKIFQEMTKKVIEKMWNVKFIEKQINIGGLKKKFDYVSEDGNFIGDAKYYKSLKTPSAKLSTIAEYVWLLEKTNAGKKFLIFGNDIDIPMKWLDRFGYITNVEFYFYDLKELKLLNKKSLGKKSNFDFNKNNPLLSLSVWKDEDFNYLKELRKDMNKWKTKY